MFFIFSFSRAVFCAAPWLTERLEEATSKMLSSIIEKLSYAGKGAVDIFLYFEYIHTNVKSSFVSISIDRDMQQKSL